MPPSKPVVVCGSANYDLFCYMAKFPKPGETIHGRAASACCGGKGANQAVMSARMGAPTAMLAKLGKDAFGETIRRGWAEDGVDASHVLEAPEGVPTGQAQIWVEDEGGMNSIVIIPAANGLLSPQDVAAAEELIAGAAVLLCQMEIPPKTTREALRLARKHGVPTILNTAPCDPKSVDAELLSLASIISPNEVELANLTGLPAGTMEEIAAASLRVLEMAAQGSVEDSDRTIIVTLGSRGSFLMDAKDQSQQGLLIPCPVVEKVVDTSGAGDCFLGSLAAYLAAGVPLEAAIRRAGSVASLSVQRAGTQTSYPKAEELPANLRLP